MCVSVGVGGGRKIRVGCVYVCRGVCSREGLVVLMNMGMGVCECKCVCVELELWVEKIS